MNSPESSQANEINLLLVKIDEYSLMVNRLKDELQSEQKTRTRLERRLEMIEKNKLSQTRQQTRIMRQQEEVVRDLSCELDQVSRKLRKSKILGCSWEDKVKALEEKVQEKEKQHAELREKLRATEEKLKKQASELRDAQTIVELYEQLKMQSRNEEIRLHQERKSIYKKAKEIYKSYRNIQNEISRSEIKLKENLSKSAVLPMHSESEAGQRKMSASRTNDERSQHRRTKILEKRINIYKTENLFLKKKIISLLNQYCAEFPQDRSQMSDVETSFYQRSLNHTQRKPASALPVNCRKKSINRLMSSKRNHEFENSLFKINTLKLPIQTQNKSVHDFKNSGKNKKLEQSAHRKSNLEVYDSSRRLQEQARRGKSAKSDLVKSNHFNISCIEDSTVIGGKTFHVVTQRDLRKISKHSEQDQKQFVSRARSAFLGEEHIVNEQVKSPTSPKKRTWPKEPFARTLCWAGP